MVKSKLKLSDIFTHEIPPLFAVTMIGIRWESVFKSKFRKMPGPKNNEIGNVVPATLRPPLSHVVLGNFPRNFAWVSEVYFFHGDWRIRKDNYILLTLMK